MSIASIDFKDPLDTIIGQNGAVATLRNAVSHDRLAGSYLFIGPSGVGKATAALRFAALLCGAKSEDDRITTKILNGTHPDVRVVQPTGKSNTIHIGQLWPRGERDFPSERALLRDLHFEPMAGPKRVFIIDGAEGLRGGNDAAGNSILKSLEEPPPYAVFILTAESLSSLLPTIVSRCQIVRFGLASAEEIERLLTHTCLVDAAKARFLAAFSEGRIGYAVTLSRSNDLLAAREELLDLAASMITAKPIQAFKLSEEFRKLAPRLKSAVSPDAEEDKEASAREPILKALDMLALYFRDLILMNSIDNSADAGIVNIDRRHQMAELVRQHNESYYADAVEKIMAVRYAIDRNANTQLALEVLFTQIML